jgi:hypothetical protein
VKKNRILTALYSLFGAKAAKSPSQVTDTPDGRKVGLHVLSDFGDTHEFVSEAPDRGLITSTIRALEWRNGFHQVILVTAPGVSMEVGGSLDPSDGFSSVYQDENNDIYRVTVSPPGTVGDMEAILVSFLLGDGRWEGMYDYR